MKDAHEFLRSSVVQPHHSFRCHWSVEVKNVGTLTLYVVNDKPIMTLDYFGPDKQCYGFEVFATFDDNNRRGILAEKLQAHLG